MKKYQEDWIESLTEYTSPFGKSNMDNNVLGVCCKILGDDTGQTDALSVELARVLQMILMSRIMGDR